MRLPERFPIDGIGMQSPLAEKRHNDFAIGGTGRRSPAIHVVRFLRLARPGHVFPQQPAVARVETKHDPLLAVLERRGEKYPLTPNHRRRLPAPLQRRLPYDRRCVPHRRQVGFGGMSVTKRTAPLRPIPLGCARGGIDPRQRQDHANRLGPADKSQHTHLISKQKNLSTNHTDDL